MRILVSRLRHSSRWSFYILLLICHCIQLSSSSRLLTSREYRDCVVSRCQVDQAVCTKNFQCLANQVEHEGCTGRQSACSKSVSYKEYSNVLTTCLSLCDEKTPYSQEWINLHDCFLNCAGSPHQTHFFIMLTTLLALSSILF